MMSQGTGSQNVGCRPLRISKTFSKGHWGQNYFIIKDTVYFFHCVDICTGDTKVLKGKTPWASERIKAKALNIPLVTVFSQSHTSIFKKAGFIKECLWSSKIILLNLNPECTSFKHSMQ